MTSEKANISRTAVWLKAFRLHTLPLAFACIGLGNFLAYANGTFHAVIAIFTFLTALFLQILSNLANDFGDSKHGADNEDRLGPKRMVQSGMITMNQIKTGIVIFMLLSLVSGVILLILSIAGIGYKGAMVLFVLGLFSIGAAVAYTASRKPYGYRGLGDLSVFIFFGLVAVFGSFYVQSGQAPFILLLPSIAMGLLCTAVLNVNNMRDIEADIKANKVTIPIKLGLKNAKIYHWILLTLPIVLFAIYMMGVTLQFWRLLFLIPAVLFIINGIEVNKSNTPEALNPFLKRLAISIMVFTICYGIGLII